MSFAKIAGSKEKDVYVPFCRKIQKYVMNQREAQTPLMNNIVQGKAKDQAK